MLQQSSEQNMGFQSRFVAAVALFKVAILRNLVHTYSAMVCDIHMRFFGIYAL